MSERHMTAEAWLRDVEGVAAADWAGWLGIAATTTDEELVQAADDVIWCADQGGVDLVGINALCDRLRAEARTDAAE